MVDYSSKVNIHILVRKFNSRVSDITTFRLIIIPSTRKHATSTT
jgi:hypothetical protein